MGPCQVCRLSPTSNINDSIFQFNRPILPNSKLTSNNYFIKTLIINFKAYLLK